MSRKEPQESYLIEYAPFGSPEARRRMAVSTEERCKVVTETLQSQGWLVRTWQRIIFVPDVFPEVPS
jgi:hypothetical protein